MNKVVQSKEGKRHNKQLDQMSSFLRFSLFWGFWAIIGLLAIWYTSLNWSDEARQNTRWQSVLASARELENQIDADVLLGTKLQIRDTDSLDQAIQMLHSQVANLAQLDGNFIGTTNQEVDTAIQAYWTGLQEKLHMLEMLMTQATFLHNGLENLPVMIEEFYEENSLVSQELWKLSNDLYQLNLYQEDQRTLVISRHMEELSNAPDLTSDQKAFLDDILFDVRIHLDAYAAFASIRNIYLYSPSTKNFEQLVETYNNYHDEVSKTFKSRFMFVLAIAIVLVVVIGRMAWKLYQQNHISHENMRRVSNAVESLSECFTLFDVKGNLVLHNRLFVTSFPKFKDLLGNNFHLAEMDKTWGNIVAATYINGKLADEPPRLVTLKQNDTRRYYQRLKDDRWFLVSDGRTEDGGYVSIRVEMTATKKAEDELRKLSNALNQSPIAVLITDKDGIIEYVNSIHETLSGYSPEELLGKNVIMLKAPESESSDDSEMWKELRQGKIWEGMFLNMRKNGEVYWEMDTISPIRDLNGDITHYVAIKEDITRKKEAEDALRLNSTVFETVSEGIVITDSNNTIQSINPAFTKMTGYLPDEVIGKSPSILNSGRQSSDFYDDMWSSLKEKGAWNGEIWNKRKNGTIYPEWLSIVKIEGKAGSNAQHIAVFSDITQRKKDEERIHYQANFDALTGLPNRFLLKDRVKQAIKKAKRAKNSTAILFIDLDRFKTVNDSMGHRVGDELLKEVAIRLKNNLRSTETLARIGGDEFVVVAEGLKKPKHAAQLAQKIVKCLCAPFEIEGANLFIGASVGIATYPQDATNQELLLQHADMAMYQAKESGKACYRFFTESMNAEIQKSNKLEQELRSAMENDKLKIVYQPLSEPTTGRVLSCEALLRFKSDKLGHVSPSEFIPLAEKTGLIGPIGLWVLNRACDDAQAWQENGLKGVRVAVNVSSRQLSLGFDHNDVRDALERSGLPGEMLTLEITEGVTMDQQKEPIVWMNKIKALGVKFSIDDFGTGYSSLSYLKDLPIDTLKIDRTFVQDIHNNENDKSLAKAIIAMSHGLSLKVIAEGVETKDQLQILTDMNCDVIQGYYFSRPLELEEFTKYSVKANYAYAE